MTRFTSIAILILVLTSFTAFGDDDTFSANSPDYTAKYADEFAENEENFEPAQASLFPALPEFGTPLPVFEPAADAEDGGADDLVVQNAEGSEFPVN